MLLGIDINKVLLDSSLFNAAMPFIGIFNQIFMLFEKECQYCY